LGADAPLVDYSVRLQHFEFMANKISDAIDTQ